MPQIISMIYENEILRPLVPLNSGKLVPKIFYFLITIAENREK